jgi:ATP-binding cassette subfamily C protein CydC
MAQLLLRFYPFEQGKILINELDIKTIPQETVRRRIALVSQSVYLFNLTVRKNLLMAKPEADDKELIEVLNEVGLKTWLEGLPKGLDTWLGEQGAFLSGGERQRLTLARARLQNADLVIFDEPTANLDAITAQALIPSLLDGMGNTSVLWITHHLAGLEKMDEIMVMDGGRIIETGRHEQLIQTGGLYAKMWKIQHQLL